MDSRGNIYEKLNELEVKDVESKKIFHAKEVKFDDLIPLTLGQKDMLTKMNRKDRRQWYRDFNNGKEKKVGEETTNGSK